MSGKEWAVKMHELAFHWEMCLFFSIIFSLLSIYFFFSFLLDFFHITMEANKQFNLNMALCVHYANYISVCEKHMAN